MSKLSTLLALTSLLTFSQVHSQTLPFDFEDSLSSSNFVDFSGGGAIVMANPFSGGINTSDSVARIIRNGGQIWAGSKIILSANLDFSVLTKISMKVYTTAPIGTVVKLKLEGSAPSVEADAFTSTSGAWETLEWIFAGTPNTLNELVFMFDYGNIGNGSASSTFYFDDVQQVPGPPAPQLISLPIDFESGIVSSDFLNFAGAGAILIANPQKQGINTSNTVCEIIRNGGDLWAGATLLLDSVLDLSNMWHFSTKVFTSAPVGTRMKLELLGPTSSHSIDAFTSVSGAWETIEWNFHGQPNTFNKMAFLFDFGHVGDGSASSTFLFDDVQQFVGPPLPAPVPTSLPIDFESGMLSSDFTNEFGATGSVVANPQVGGINTSDTVGHIIKSGGHGYARTKLILTNNMDFSTLSSISMKVYSDAPVGSILKLKVESTTSGAANERDAYSTVSGDWATYTWDFAGDPPVYNVLTFMMGYGVIGDASPTSTFLIDDIEQVAGLPPLPKASLPINFENGVSTASFLDFDGAGSTVISNPEKNGINPSDSVGKMVRNGGQIWAGSKLYLDTTLDFSSFPYLTMKVFTQAPIGTTAKLKLEGTAGAETEVDVVTTVSGEWETLKWDFSGEPSIYQDIVFMFDYGAIGDSSSASTFLFDDVEQTDGTSSNTGLDLMPHLEVIKSFPNPATEFINFAAESTIESISLFDVLGNEVLSQGSNSNEVRMDVIGIASGVYTAQITTSKSHHRLKIVIE